MDGNPFLKIQRLGRALMLPIAVLPVAGLLLRLGQPDVFNIKMIADAGGAIFDNLPLLFAIGVAVGFAKDNNGVAGLAGAIGYLIEIAVMKDINDKLNMGVLSGIVAGIVAGLLYNKYKDIKLPDYLAFFGGKRFVPIVTGVVCLVLGIVFGYVWQPVQGVIDTAGHWLTTRGRARRVRVRRAEPSAARHGSASHPQFADVVRVRHLHAAGRRCGDGRPASLLRGRPDRGHVHDGLLPGHDVRPAGRVSRDVSTKHRRNAARWWAACCSRWR